MPRSPVSSSPVSSSAQLPLDRQRIDKWLWHARVVRTRSAAASLAASGHVRINGHRVDAASRTVRAGDVVTVALDRAVHVLKVLNFADRRGSAEEARMLREVIDADLLLDSGACATQRARSVEE